jgi:hypothetical protein
MEVSSVALPLGKQLTVVAWIGSRAVLNVVEKRKTKLLPLPGIEPRTFSHTARSLVAIRTESSPLILSSSEGKKFDGE